MPKFYESSKKLYFGSILSILWQIKNAFFLFVDYHCCVEFQKKEEQIQRKAGYRRCDRRTVKLI